MSSFQHPDPDSLASLVPPTLFSSTPVHPILVELDPPREPKLSTAIRSTLFLCTSVYAVTALFGYLLFGEATYADVLANFDRELGVPGSAVLNVVVRVFYVVHLALVFPVIHFSLRAATASVVFPSAVPISHHPREYVLVTIGLVLGIFVLSSSVPDVQFAFQFVGATGAAALVFIFPGLIALRWVGGWLGGWTGARLRRGATSLCTTFFRPLHAIPNHNWPAMHTWNAASQATCILCTAHCTLCSAQRCESPLHCFMRVRTFPHLLRALIS